MNEQKNYIWVLNPHGVMVEVDEKRWSELEKQGFKRNESSTTKGSNQADLNFVSVFWASNGMGRVGEEVLLSLDKLGLKVKVIPDYLVRDDLQERTLELIDMSESYDKADTTLYYAVPKILPRDMAEKNFLHIDWDTTIAPDIWVKNINKYIDKVYPSSEFVENVFSKSGVKVPMQVIRHGVRTDRFPMFKRDYRGDFTFLTCGDISKRKGTDILIEAFQEAFPDNKDVKLVIKSNKKLEWGKINKPNDDRIEVITERYTHEDYLELYKEARCYVAPSRDEGFCLPALEAMATALPVIIHNWSGMASLANKEYNFPIGSGDFMNAEAWIYPEEYQDGKGIGYWRNPDKKELIEKMRYVYRNRDKAKEIGLRASKWAKEEWDWDNQVKKMWIDIIKSSMPSFQTLSKPKEREWGEFYEKSILTKDSIQSSGGAHKELFDIIKSFSPKKVIESGCGPATMSIFLSWPEHNIQEVIAVDNDANVLKQVEKNIKDFGGKNIKAVNADAFTYSETADVVFSQGVLEHFDNDELKRIIDNQLKQAPIVIHSVPNNDYKKIDFGNERLLTDEQYLNIFAGYDITIYRYWKEDSVKKMSILVFKRNDGSSPQTSIIMPVFNHLDYNKKAIKAVREHTKNYELMVIDNASTDGTKEWLDNQVDIRVVHLNENRGVPGAKNIGITMARGKYICFLDNDTEVGEGWLDKMLDVFKDKTVGFTAHEGYFVNKDTGYFLQTKVETDSLVDWSPHSVFVFPRRLVSEIGLLLDDNLWCVEDVDQCCKIRMLGYKGKLPEVKVNCNHKAGMTALTMDLAKAKNFEVFTRNMWNKWKDFLCSRSLSSRIDIGSGDNPHKGYIHFDIQKVPHVDVVAKADDLGLPDNSVGEIYSSHLFEHFTREQLDNVLIEWHRVLENDGYLVIKCPDILKVCEKLVKKNVDYDLGVAWIYGGQRTKWDYHYWSYCFDSLKDKLEKIGFVGVESLPDVDDWLKVMARVKKEKKHTLDKNQLKVLFRGTHHHIMGGGENMTFGVIRMLDELHDDFEVDIDLSMIDTKKAFGLEFKGLKKDSGRHNDLFISISHFSLPQPKADKNIAVVFYPQYDWKNEIRNYNKVVAISEFSKRAIKRKWDVDSDVIFPAVDVSKFKVGEKKNQIISVGRFFWHENGNMKNQHILIEAFSKMPKDWKLVLVGSIQHNQYYNLLKKMAIGLNVEFKHDISFEELTDLYAESKVYWSATGYGTDIESSQEHFGMVAVEALASGCKTLVFNGGGMAEINGVETWETIDELVKETLDDSKYDIRELVKGVDKYSFKNIKEDWKKLIGELCKE
jgi:glycosyltransferase involved in cell wall biosynthesis/ubiquinone/menaquinone biosynthesis C-methylase UbiE